MNSVDANISVTRLFPLKEIRADTYAARETAKTLITVDMTVTMKAVEKILTDIELCKDGDVSVKHPFFWKTQTAWRLLEGVEKYPQDRIQGNDQHERHQQIPKHFYRN